MANHSSYRNGSHSRSYFPSIASLSSSDSGQFYGSMGPPPPQPVEIDVDLSNSRTLPSPSASGASNWDPLLQPHGFGDGPYGSSNMARMQQLPMDNQARGPTQDPLVNWYVGNDGPWVPKVIPEVSIEERTHTRQTGNRHSVSFGSNYRQPYPSEAGSVHYGVAPSDSGYGTRRSVGNASVFSADVMERDQDCQSLAAHVENFQPFHGFNDQQRDSRTNESWTRSNPPSTGSDSPNLVCPTCRKAVKTQSELKKHDLRHRKPFKCTVQGCLRAEGFSTTNDLDRHTRSKHPSTLDESIPTKRFRCHVQGCKSKDKTWPRLDNFRSHLKRVHFHQLTAEEDFEDTIRRAECWEKATIDIDHDNLFSQHSFQDSTRAARSSAVDNYTNFRRSEPDWRTPYPDVLSPSEALMAPKLPQLDKYEAKTVPQEGRSPNHEADQSNTVQPSEMLRAPAVVSENKFLVNILAAPAGSTDSTNENADPSPKQAPQSKLQGKTFTKQNVVSAADAADITKVIRDALPESNPNLANDCVLPQDQKRNSLPGGKTSPCISRHHVPKAAASTRDRTPPPINLLDIPATGVEIDPQIQSVLKRLAEAGYTVRRERSRSPKIQNSGSVAGNKSENQVICDTCKRFKGRPCELKKHMKRHERPYGCTFLTCNKTFGSKNDWKRHENSQHFQIETWRCDEDRPEGGACAKVCYRKQTFHEHLSKEHQISGEEDVKRKVETCRIGRNCQARFWCGFCTKLIELKKKGLDAWTERFDHIDDHFMGRHSLIKQSIQDWVPVDSDKPKGDVTSDGSAGKEGLDSGSDILGSAGASPDSPGSAAAGTSPGDAIIVGDRPASPKRKHSSGDDNSRPKKQSRAATNTVTTTYCCQCHIAHNPKFNRSCTNCDNHTFCQFCRVETMDVPKET